MADNSAIEWTDATWNPVTGCVEVSPGCDNCYAKTFAERWRGTPGHHFEKGFDLVLRPERLAEPLKWKKPRKVFVNSMSDLFHADVPDEYIAKVFAVMALTPQHTYQLLTKRHGRMRAWLNNDRMRLKVYNEAHALAHQLPSFPDASVPWPLPNVWLGVSVENQQWANTRIPALLQTPAAVRWLSMEPLLGPVNLTLLDWDGATGLDVLEHSDTDLGRALSPSIDWVVVGGESGHGARPMEPGWARSLRDQCTTADVPFFFKQWGAWAPTGWRGIGQPHPDRERLAGPELDEQGHREIIARTSKKASGRELDGRTWDQYPVMANA